MNDTEYFALQQAKQEQYRRDLERDQVMNRAVDAVDERHARETRLRREIEELRKKIEGTSDS